MTQLTVMQKVATRLFDAFFVILIAGAVVSAWQWPFATGLFPLSIGIPVLIVSLCQLVKDLVFFNEQSSGSRAGQRIRDIEVDRSIATNLVLARAGGFYLCALGFFALILLIGFQAAIPIFMVLYLRFVGHASWALTLLLACLMLGLVLGVFDTVLNVPWPDSVLESLLGIAPY